MEIVLGTNRLTSSSDRALVAVAGERLIAAARTQELPTLGLNLYDPEGAPLARVVRDEFTSDAKGLGATADATTLQIRDAQGHVVVQAMKAGTDRVEVSRLDVYARNGLRFRIDPDALGALKIYKDGILLATLKGSTFYQDRLLIELVKEGDGQLGGEEFVVSMQSRGLVIENCVFDSRAAGRDPRQRVHPSPSANSLRNLALQRPAAQKHQKKGGNAG